MRIWKKQNIELDLNQKQPGASLFQYQQLQGQRASRFLSSQSFMEYSYILGEQRERGKSCLQLTCNMEPVLLYYHYTISYKKHILLI